MFAKIIDTLVFILCLPVYLIAWPLMAFGTRQTIDTLSTKHCPHCGELFVGLSKQHLQTMSIRLRLTAGTTVDWDRLPQWKIRCPACNQPSCLDRQNRLTSCIYADHIDRKAA